MAKKPRIQTPGLVRHVMSRGSGRMSIFLDDEDHRQFTFLLGEVVHDYRVECWGYCEMSNHYHAILVPTKENISAAMRKLNGEYAQGWNRRHGRVGHVLQGPFKDQIVQTGEYLMTLIRYVARNPLRAGMVDELTQWRWGSYRALAGLETAASFLSVEAVLSRFGAGDIATLQSRFNAFVLGETVDPSIEDRFRSRDRIVGDRRFKRVVLGMPDEEIANPQRLIATTGTDATGTNPPA